MAKTTISIKIDKELKDQAEEVLNDMGLSISDAISIFLTQVMLRQEIPFEIKIPDK